MSNLAPPGDFLWPPVSLDEILKRIDRVTADDVPAYAKAIFGDELAVTAIGQIESLDIEPKKAAGGKRKAAGKRQKAIGKLPASGRRQADGRKQKSRRPWLVNQKPSRP